MYEDYQILLSTVASFLGNDFPFERELEVEVGQVDASSMPWRFLGKVKEIPGLVVGQPPIKCQLHGAADMPVSALFESLCDRENGKVKVYFFYRDPNSSSK
jgi:hypothetical protein